MSNLPRPVGVGTKEGENRVPGLDPSSQGKALHLFPVPVPEGDALFPIPAAEVDALSPLASGVDTGLLCLDDADDLGHEAFPDHVGR